MIRFFALLIAIPVSIFVFLPCYFIGGIAGIFWVALQAGWDMGPEFLDEIFEKTKGKND